MFCNVHNLIIDRFRRNYLILKLSMSSIRICYLYDQNIVIFNQTCPVNSSIYLKFSVSSPHTISHTLIKSSSLVVSSINIFGLFDSYGVSFDSIAFFVKFTLPRFPIGPLFLNFFSISYHKRIRFAVVRRISIRVIPKY